MSIARGTVLTLLSDLRLCGESRPSNAASRIRFTCAQRAERSAAAVPTAAAAHGSDPLTGRTATVRGDGIAARCDKEGDTLASTRPLTAPVPALAERGEAPGDTLMHGTSTVLADLRADGGENPQLMSGTSTCLGDRGIDAPLERATEEAACEPAS